MKSYQLMIDFGLYPSGKVVLGCFSTYSRYCGPREAVFTAICRKNMGCSHFIVGRDHTGVDGFYKDYDIRELFDKLSDLGVIPLFYENIGYDPAKQIYCSTESTDTKSISGSEIREALRQNKELPEWFMRENVQNMLRLVIASGKEVFYE
jgi:ATP sulfurylase